MRTARIPDPRTPTGSHRRPSASLCRTPPQGDRAPVPCFAASLPSSQLRRSCQVGEFRLARRRRAGRCGASLAWHPAGRQDLFHRPRDPSPLAAHPDTTAPDRTWLPPGHGPTDGAAAPALRLGPCARLPVGSDGSSCGPHPRRGTGPSRRTAGCAGTERPPVPQARAPDAILRHGRVAGRPAPARGTAARRAASGPWIPSPPRERASRHRRLGPGTVSGRVRGASAAASFKPRFSGASRATLGRIGRAGEALHHRRCDLAGRLQSARDRLDPLRRSGRAL